jgi:hypothetical protein
MCQSTIEDAQEILRALPTDEEATLPTWWTNKLAVTSAYINSLRDYLLYQPTETMEMNSEKDEMEESEDEMEDEMKESEEEDESEEEEDESEDEGQVTVGDYTTKHFDICPSAQKLYSNIQGKTDMIHLVVETMMLHDLFFRLEKQAIAMGSIDAEELAKAQGYADLIMENAKRMNLETEHAYIEDVHMAKFKQLAGMEEEDETMLPPSVRIVRNALKAR